MLKHLLTSVAVTFLVAGNLRAYDLETHRKLSETSVSESVLTKNQSVLKDLGLADVDETLPFEGNRRSILDIIGRGARLEDTLTTARPVNHFFDPTRAGAANNGAARGFVSVLNPASSPSWALEDLQAHGGQDNSFRDARKYLLEALTSGAKSTREEKFAATFQTLGMVIHHLQDMAQPQHVRNDLHCSEDVCKPFFHNPSAYEKYTEAKPNLPVTGYSSAYAGYASVLNSARKFWYTGDGKGIAEFTNRNFVTDSTNFRYEFGSVLPDARYGFPLPLASGAPTISIQDAYQQSGRGAVPQQLQDFCGANCWIEFVATSGLDQLTGDPVDNPRASSLSIFDPDLRLRTVQLPSSDGEIRFETGRVFSLNSFNFDAALAVLMKRAVGYSAGLIDYFFRGKIDLVAGPQNSGQLLVKNLGAEAMKGKFRLYYDDADDVRRTVRDANGAPILWDTEVILAATSAGQLAAGAQMAVPAFSAPTNPGPKNPPQYMLVFTGEMGEEKPVSETDGAVVGKLVRGPAYKGVLYVAGLDANDEVVSFKVDTGGVAILSGRDVSRADANNPGGVLVSNATKFDPLGRVYAAARQQGLPPVGLQKGYAIKQIEFETSALGMSYTWASAAFYLPSPSPGITSVQGTYSYLARSPVNPQQPNRLIWVAKSPDPALGTFDFVVLGTPFAPTQSANVNFTRRYVENGAQRLAFGSFALPALTGAASYSSFFGQAASVRVSGDGTVLSEFVRTVAGGIARSRVVIELAPTPIARLETIEYRDVTESQGGTFSESKVGTCSVTLTDFGGNSVTNTGDRMRVESTPATSMTRREDRLPIEYINAELAAYARSTNASNQSSFWRESCSAGGGHWQAGVLTTKVHYERSADTVRQSSTRAEARLEGGAFVDQTTQGFNETTSPWDPRFPITSFTHPYSSNISYSYSFEGIEPAPSVQITSRSAAPRTTSTFALNRALSHRFRDAVYSESPAENLAPILWFRDRNITGKAYLADASPLGELFFALEDMSELVHEPIPGGMLTLTRDKIPANVVRLLAAVWM